MNASSSEIAIALRQFETAVARRRAREQEFRETFESIIDSEEVSLEQQLQQVVEQRDQTLAAHSSEFELVSQELEAYFTQQINEVQQEHDYRVREAEQLANRELQQIDDRHRDSEWVVSSVMDDTAEDSPRRQFERFKQVLLRAREEQSAEWTSLDESFRELVERRRWRDRPPVEPADPPKNRETAQKRFQQTVEDARNQQSFVESLKIPKLFLGFRPVYLGLVLTAAAFVPVWMFVDPKAIGLNMTADSSEWIGVVAGTAVGFAVLLLALVYSLGAFQFADGMRRLQQLVAEAGWVNKIWLGFAKDELQKQQEQFEARQVVIDRQREQTLERYNKARDERQKRIEVDRAQTIREARQELNERLGVLNQDRNEQLQAIQSEFERRMKEAQSHFAELLRQAENALEDYRNDRDSRKSDLWESIKSDWQRGTNSIAHSSAHGKRQKSPSSLGNRLTRRIGSPTLASPGGYLSGNGNSI